MQTPVAVAAVGAVGIVEAVRTLLCHVASGVDGAKTSATYMIVNNLNCDIVAQSTYTGLREGQSCGRPTWLPQLQFINQHQSDRQQARADSIAH